MWSFLASLFTGGLSALLGTVGKTITDIHADNTTRYKNEGDAGKDPGDPSASQVSSSR
jgi:hypothetical protein